MLTEEGAKKVLAMAATAPDSRGFIRWVMGMGIEVGGQSSGE
jgi:hypothetical protein